MRLRTYPVPRGRIDLITGPMFSGKSTELISRALQAHTIGHEVLLLRPVVDTRGNNDAIRTHDSIGIPCDTIMESADIMDLVSHSPLFPDTLLVDEGQFWDANLPQVLENVRAMKMHVIVSGLTFDYALQPFGPMPTVHDIANSVLALRAICHVCRRPAAHTYRKSGEGPQVVVGGTDQYEARCGDCYYRRNFSSEMQTIRPSDWTRP